MRYPFTPERLEALPEPIAQLFRDLEDRLLQEICRRLNAADDLNEVSVEMIRELRAHGIDLEQIKQAIAETSNAGMAKVEKLLVDVAERNAAYYAGVASVAKVMAPKDFVDAETLEAIRRQTRAEFRNLTQSMGFTIRRGGKVVQRLSPQKAYLWALDRAETEIMSGTISYRDAISHAVKDLSRGGITTVRYESDGRVKYDQVDVAVRRAVMTGVNQTCQKYAEQSMEELDTDIVEVSAHVGARNTGLGIENHEQWQGKVYARNKPGKPKNTKYPDFVEKTGYGSGAGLGGWNCRHHFYAYLDGISSPAYTKEQLDGMKGENRKATFQGREYDGYQATQKQRSIERTIRALKRERDAYKAAGLDDDAKTVNARIRSLSGQYKRFSKAMGLPEQRDRMKVEY